MAASGLLVAGCRRCSALRVTAFCKVSEGCLFHPQPSAAADGTDNLGRHGSLTWNVLSSTDVTPTLSISDGDAVHAAAALAAEAAAGAAAAAVAAAEAAAAAECAGGEKMAEAAAKTALAAQAAAEAEARAAAAEAAAAALAAEKTAWGVGKTIWGRETAEEGEETSEDEEAAPRRAPVLVNRDDTPGALRDERPFARVQDGEGQGDGRKRETSGDGDEVTDAGVEAEGELASQGGTASTRASDESELALCQGDEGGQGKQTTSTSVSALRRPLQCGNSTAGSNSSSVHTSGGSASSRCTPYHTGGLSASRGFAADLLDTTTLSQSCSSFVADHAGEAAAGLAPGSTALPAREKSRPPGGARKKEEKKEKEVERRRSEKVAQAGGGGGGGHIYAQGLLAGHVHAGGNDGFGFPRWSDVVVLQILQNRPVLAAALLSDLLAALLRGKATVQR